MDQSAPLLTIRDVSKSFGNGTQALAGLNLDVRDGEFLSLLGPSGCGKSTVLRLIAGLAAPSSGTLAWRDTARPDIGFVFQEPTLMPWASVARNVWLPLRLRGVTWDEAAPAIDEVLRLVGLETFAQSYPRELSGGMKMRVSIARALVTKPAMLLMDEPFAALDEITRARLNDDLLSLAHTLNTTIIFVTHSVQESVYLSHRVAMVSARPGHIVENVDVAAPSERGDSWRRDPAYHATCQHLSRLLEQPTQVRA